METQEFKQYVAISLGGMKHLLKVFPPATVMSGPDYKNLLGVSTSLELPSVPIILSILTGLSKGNVDIQICISEHEFLPLLHCLEVSGKLLVGAKAEMLMDLLGGLGVDSEKSFLKVTVSTIRKITKDEMKNRALRKRDQLLQVCGVWMITFLWKVESFRHVNLSGKRENL